MNVNLMVKNVIQTKSETTINVDVSAKIKENMCVKKTIFRILAHVLVKILNI